MNWGVERIIETPSGNVIDRIRSNSSGIEMEIIKPMDQVSPLLFAHVWGGKAIPEVQIHACYASVDSFIPYLQCTLSNVMVSEYSAHVDAESALELIALNYTDIENSYTEYDSQGLPDSSNRAQGQIGSKPSLFASTRKQIQARTKEGFELFVAVVYGEMAGARGSPEKAWEAVGSVIINRVGTNVWHRHHTVEYIIENTGFDEYVDPKRIKNWNNNKHFFDTPPVLKHEQFIKAWAYFHSQKINNAPALNLTEQDVLIRMKTLLEPIYYKRKTVTKANYYYSPKGMHGKTTSFLVNLVNPEQYRVYLAGLNDNELKLYNIPAKAERRANHKVVKKK